MTDGRYGGEEAEEDRESKGGKQQETILFMFISLKDGSSGSHRYTRQRDDEHEDIKKQSEEIQKEGRSGGGERRQISIAQFQFFVFFCTLSAIYMNCNVFFF